MVDLSVDFGSGTQARKAILGAAQHMQAMSDLVSRQETTALIATDKIWLGTDYTPANKGKIPASAEWIGNIWSDHVMLDSGFQRLATAGEGLGADVIYGDDLTLESGQVKLRLKPVFDPLLLESLDYMGRSVLFRRAALSPGEAEKLANGTPPAAIVRGRTDLKVAHLPLPILCGPAATPMAGSCPFVDDPKTGIVIPNRNSPALIETIMTGLLDATTGPELEIVIVDNGSDDPAVLALYDAWQTDPRVRVLVHEEPFNFARMVNRGVEALTADTILLLNNDVEVIRADWLRHMHAVLAKPDVGIVGAKLLFPDRTIQHAGVVMGHGGVAGHIYKGASEERTDPLYRLSLPHRREAVTAAAMLIERQVWADLYGFDERAFPIAFNDVDFCLRAGAAGHVTAMAPDAVLIHHEGASRKGFSLMKFLRHQQERSQLRLRHHTIGRIDRYQSPWHDPAALIPEFRMLKQLPSARL